MRGALRRLVSEPVQRWERSLPYRAVVSALVVTVIAWLLAAGLLVAQLSVSLSPVIGPGERDIVRDAVIRAELVSALVLLPVLGGAIYWISLQVCLLYTSRCV